jgi:hypothetical protein
MKTKPDPLRYAIDEGFIKIVWFMEGDEPMIIYGCTEEVKKDIKLDQNRIYFHGDVYNILAPICLRTYAQGAVGRGAALMVIEKFYTDTAESIVAVDEVLTATDAYNLRKELDEKDES